MMIRITLHLTAAMTIALLRTSSGMADTQREPKREIVVSVADRKLALIEDGQVVKTYAAAVGASSSPSPAGEFTITHRIPKPTYYAPGKIIGPGASNPLGTRWLGLSLKGFGIHGTNAPRSIGKNQSHGCIRLRNRDVEDLFERVRAGDRVEIHQEIDDRVAVIFAIHKTLQQPHNPPIRFWNPEPQCLPRSSRRSRKPMRRAECQTSSASPPRYPREEIPCSL